MRRFYFAYGSNLCIEQMDQRCPGHRPVRAHRLHGYRLVLRGPADVEPAESEYVDGAIYEIDEEHERILDGFESFPDLYGKVRFPIDEGEAMLYRMVVTEYRKPRAGYVDIIRQGFSDWGLDNSTLERAVKRQKEEYGKDA